MDELTIDKTQVANLIPKLLSSLLDVTSLHLICLAAILDIGELTESSLVMGLTCGHTHRALL